MITYASGKGADVVIWVVKYAREEHKAAVEWLNNHTDDKIGFFLCEIKLFQIGDSDIAPSFTVVERPNDWTKEIKKTTATNPTQQQRLEYWQAFNDYAFQNAEFNKAIGWILVLDHQLVISQYLKSKKEMRLMLNCT